MTMPTEAGALRLDAGLPAVRFERRYATDPADLWSAVTDADRLQRWFHRVCGELSPGGRFSIDFEEGGTGSGQVQACDPPRSFRATWDFEGEPASLLEVAIRADGDGAVLVLDHSRLPAAQGVGYSAGWHGYLDLLAAHMAGSALPDWGARWSALMPQYRVAFDAVTAGSTA